MAPIGYAKPSMFPHLQGPTLNHLTTARAVITYPLGGFSRLQGLSKRYFQAGNLDTPGVFPLSAPYSWDVTNRTPILTLPVLRFSQPSNRFQRPFEFAGLFHPAGTPRVWPSKLYLKVIVLRFPYSCSFVVTCLP
jgi:hypothetical protein